MVTLNYALLQRVSGYQQLQLELGNLLQADWYAHVNQRDYAGNDELNPLPAV